MAIINIQKSISDAIAIARQKGYNTSFRFLENMLIDREKLNTYGVNDCMLDEFYRLEGLSDPADASILFLITCNDGIKGYLSSAYGIYADADLIQFMLELERK